MVRYEQTTTWQELGLVWRFSFDADPFQGQRQTVKARLSEQYGGDPEKWSHNAGEGWMYDPRDNGKIKRGEVHWMENEDVGMVEFWFKRWAKGWR